MWEWEVALSDSWCSLSQGGQERSPEGDGTYMTAQDEEIAEAFRHTYVSLEGHLVTVVKG